MTKVALQAMWDAKDEEGYQKSLDMYEKAFELFPDSINNSGLYKSSVLASRLKDYDKAFGYLNSLIGRKMNKYGDPGYIYVLNSYAEGEYKNLLTDPRWSTLVKDAENYKALFYQRFEDNENEFYAIKAERFREIDKPEKLYKELKNFNPYKTKALQGYSISFNLDENFSTSFFIQLPENYSPDKKYPLLFILHGAVKHNSLAAYQLAEQVLGGWNRYYTKYAAENDVILAFPKGNKKFNWMVPNEGFFMIPEMLKLIKNGVNVDDNKVFISGHSNGATGSFSYLMKQPTEFAGFYGLNTYPKVFTGGTFIENIKNRSFMNFSTDQDYYYPPNANDQLTALMNEMNADYKEHRYKGFPHWFPEFDESEPAFQKLYDDLKTRTRDPFPKEITWEFDDNSNGQIDWLSNIKLDSLASKADWHKEINFKIDKWLEYKDKNSDILSEKEVDKNAFDLPRKSGKIVAKYEDNTFYIKTSAIKTFTINISPEMVDHSKRVKVYLNGKKYFNDKVDYDSNFMIENFERNRDRSQVWVNQIKIELK
ncbi:alpha/beta hydrolase-fold protein [Roseivirga misakiensis]|nr:alpha/beta hydrolase-fold protein [Roseivirga misakiensis]